MTRNLWLVILLVGLCEGTPNFAKEVSSGSYPLLWNVPHRNETYVSRKEYEQQLNDRLNNKADAGAVILVGMTGIGKTQLAKEYAHRHHKDYDIVWWFDASKDLSAQFKEFAYEWNQAVAAEKEKIPVENLSNKVLVGYVKNCLRRTTKSWLLIFDDAKSKEVIRDFVPETHGKASAHVLVTSKDETTWGNDAIHVKQFTQNEAVLLVQKILKDKTDQEVNELVGLLGNFPLALAQAAIYLKAHPSMSVEKYVSLFNATRKNLWAAENKFLGKHTEALLDYKYAASAALQISVQEILKESKDAYDLLLFVSLIHHTKIPELLLMNWLEANQDTIGADQSISILTRQLLLDRNTTTEAAGNKVNFYNIHELIQLVIRDNFMDDHLAKGIITKSIHTVYSLFDKKLDQKANLSWDWFCDHVDKLLGFARERGLASLEDLKLRVLYLDYLLGENRDLQASKKQIDVIDDLLKKVSFDNEFYDALYNVNKGNYFIFAESDAVSGIKYLKRALKLSATVKDNASQQLRILTQLAQSSLMQGDSKEAKKYLDQGDALEAKAEDTAIKALFHYGKCFYLETVSALQDALKETEIALDLIKKGPAYPTVTFGTELMRAELLVKLGNLPAAHKQAKRASEKVKLYFGDEPNMFYTKSLLIMARSMPQETKDEQQKAIALIKEAMSKFDDLYKNATRKHQLQAWAHVLLGDMYCTQNALNDACKEYQKAEAMYDGLYTQKTNDDFSEVYAKMVLVGAKLRDETLTNKYFQLHIKHFGLKHPRTFELIKYLDDQGLRMYD